MGKKLIHREDIKFSEKKSRIQGMEYELLIFKKNTKVNRNQPL